MLMLFRGSVYIFIVKALLTMYFVAYILFLEFDNGICYIIFMLIFKCLFLCIYILLLGYVNKLDCLQCTGYVKALLIMHRLFKYLIYIYIYIYMCIQWVCEDITIKAIKASLFMYLMSL